MKKLVIIITIILIKKQNQNLSIISIILFVNGLNFQCFLSVFLHTFHKFIGKFLHWQRCSYKSFWNCCLLLCRRMIMHQIERRYVMDD